MGEECAVCGQEYQFADTVHILIHTQSEEGVVDRFACKECYEDRIAPIFE